MNENECIQYAGAWFSFEYIQRSVWRRLIVQTRREGKCIVWTGSPGLGGYGKISIQDITGRKVSARPHRLVAILFYGSLGSLEVDHICRNRLCCNIAHLEPVSGKVNTQRMHKRRHEDKYIDQEKMPWRGQVE